MALETPNPWTTMLPAVLLGIRSAVKETLGKSAAEMTYGMTLRLPGDSKENYTVDASTDLENYSDRLRVAMSRLRLSPPRDTNQKDTFQYKELDTCSHVFLQRIAIEPPLTPLYDGPYKIVARSGRVFKVLIKGKVEKVTAERVKPAHIEGTPENEQTRQSTAMSKTTAKRPTAKIREPQTVVVEKEVLRRRFLRPEFARSKIWTDSLRQRQRQQFQRLTNEVKNLWKSQIQRRQFTRRRMSGTPRVLTLTGTMVLEHIHEILYIWEKTCRFKHNRINADSITCGATDPYTRAIRAAGLCSYSS